MTSCLVRRTRRFNPTVETRRTWATVPPFLPHLPQLWAKWTGAACITEATVRDARSPCASLAKLHTYVRSV